MSRLIFFRAPTNLIPRNKFFRFGLLVFIMWLLVSTYFYFQHHRTDKVFHLDEEVRSGSNLIKFKELRLVNYQSKDQANFWLPWYFPFANNLPLPLREPFLNICMFYTPSRYEFSDEEGTLSLSGYVISPEGNFSHEDFSNRLDIWLCGPNEVGYIGGSSTQASSQYHDFLFFSIHGRHVPLNAKEISLIIDDKINKQRDKIALDPVWDTETYTFFNRKKNYNYIDPEIAVRSLIDLARDNHIAEAKAHVLPEKQNLFKWELLNHQYWQTPTEPDINYQGEYLGYQNVFTNSFVFGEFKEDDFRGIAKQEFFLIDTKDGWKVIDVSPVQKL